MEDARIDARTPVCCVECDVKGVIRWADVLVPVRTKHYDLCERKLDIDPRLMGICYECLEDKNQFQKGNTEDVDAQHKDLVYKNV